jgi:Na+-driven multidrug efflux pump
MSAFSGPSISIAKLEESVTGLFIMQVSLSERVKSPDSEPIRIAPVSLLARNATLNLLTQGWIVVVLVVAMPRLVAYLGATSFGLFSLTWVMIGYLSFLDVGVNRAATKFISKHRAEQDHESARRVVRTAIVSNLTMGLAGGLTIALPRPCWFIACSKSRLPWSLKPGSRSTRLRSPCPYFWRKGFFAPC